MIDDIQDEYTPAKQETPKNHSALKSVFSVIVVWLVFAVIAGLVNIKGLVKTLSSNSPANMVETAKDNATKTVTKNYILYFVSPDGLDVKPFESAVKVTGATEYQEAIEGLLQGPSDTVLAQGAVTYIPAGTKLLGIKIDGSMVFVNLNENFMKTEWKDADYKTAANQILRTLRMIDPSLKEITILINGNPINSIE